MPASPNPRDSRRLRRQRPRLGHSLIPILTSTPGELLRRWRSSGFVLVVSDHILSEVDHALRKPYYQARFSAQQVQTAVALLRARAESTSITVSIAGVATHPEDDLVLATAVSAATDYLVTGDHKLQKLGAYGGVTILSPAGHRVPSLYCHEGVGS